MRCFFTLLALLTSLGFCTNSPMHTEYALFLFDHGDKNMIASMLNYAKEHECQKLEQLDFKIIFMGASVECMTEEPFSSFPGKLIHYKELGIEESVGRTWKREQKISHRSLENLLMKLNVSKKVWVPASCRMSAQIVSSYQEKRTPEVAVFRDNPSPIGESDYFQVAEEVQKTANKLIVASAQFQNSSKQVIVVGSGSIEEWCEKAASLDREKIRHKLGLKPDLPVLVLTGSYGAAFEARLQFFLALLPKDPPFHFLFLPHPRDHRKSDTAISTLEAIVLADVVVTADVTSTIVFQANALNKKVLFISDQPSTSCSFFCEKGLIEKIATTEELLNAVQQAKEHRQNKDLFELFAIPKKGAELLWREFQS